jgi:hypothetical protein
MKTAPEFTWRRQTLDGSVKASASTLPPNFYGITVWNVDSLADDFFVKSFGNAAPPIKKNVQIMGI